MCPAQTRVNVPQNKKHCGEEAFDYIATLRGRQGTLMTMQIQTLKHFVLNHKCTQQDS